MIQGDVLWLEECDISIIVIKLYGHIILREEGYDM